MKQRKKPSRSWIEKSIEEIEKEAFKEGFEAGLAKACEILHDVYAMRHAQNDEKAAIENSDQDNTHRIGLCARELEGKTRCVNPNRKLCGRYGPYGDINIDAIMIVAIVAFLGFMIWLMISM